MLKRTVIALVALVALLFAAGYALSPKFSVARSTADAAWAWQSKSEGDGKMTFTGAQANRLAYDLYFPDFGTTSAGVLELAATGAGTQVTWSMNGDMGSNPLFRWLALFSDRMVGPNFEAGLASLKALAEKPQP